MIGIIQMLIALIISRQIFTYLSNNVGERERERKFIFTNIHAFIYYFQLGRVATLIEDDTVSII